MKPVFLIQGPKRAARLNLEGEFFVVGRAEPFPVFQDDPKLSREHAVVVRVGEGFVIKDLGSPNGVLLNGERVPRYEERPFEVGDSFAAGDTTVHLLSVEELERRQSEAKAITVDEKGRTGFMPVVTPATQREFSAAAATVEMAVPELPGEKTELAIDEPNFETLAAPAAQLTIPEDDEPTMDLRDLPTQAMGPGELAEEDLGDDDLLQDVAESGDPDDEEPVDVEDSELELPTDSELELE